jgi:hypothetical protein
MALLRAARTAQTPLAAEFVFNFNDTMVDVNGVTKTFGSVYTDAGTFEVIPLPSGAIITGGELIVEVQGVGPTAYTVSVGNSSSATAYLAATSVLTAVGTRTALTGLGYNAVANAGGNMRITIASTVANASAGKVRVRVEYTIDRRATETQIV